MPAVALNLRNLLLLNSGGCIVLVNRVSREKSTDDGSLEEEGERRIKEQMTRKPRSATGGRLQASIIILRIFLKRKIENPK